MRFPSHLMYTAIIYIVAALFVFLLTIYILALCLWRQDGEAIAPAAPLPCGLGAAAIASLPSLALRAADMEEGVECVICLNELAEGEPVRKLPLCGHVFHVACIDMWFHSHRTCPLCRTTVIPAKPKVADSSVVDRSPISANASEASTADSGSSTRREEEVIIEIP